MVTYEYVQWINTVSIRRSNDWHALQEKYEFRAKLGTSPSRFKNYKHSRTGTLMQIDRLSEMFYFNA